MAASDAPASTTVTPKVAVVIPCYRVRDQILPLLHRMGPEVAAVYCVDDACPDKSGELITSRCNDPRVVTLFHETNQGVGGATRTGFRRALEDGAEIIVKLDGDGQMDPGNLPQLIAPLVACRADFCKGNRLFDPESAFSMPRLRLLGNLILSFLTKISSGYWHIFDPTNGYIAVRREALLRIPLHKLAAGYFFETDLLFRLNVARAVVAEIPMTPRYGDEKSNLRIARIILPFLFGHLRNFTKRIIYDYFLRDFHVASIELVLGTFAVLFGAGFGLTEWLKSYEADAFASAGTVMVAALPIIVGVQLLLAAVSYDISNTPREPICMPRSPPRGGGHA